VNDYYILRLSRNLVSITTTYCGVIWTSLFICIYVRKEKGPKPLDEVLNNILYVNIFYERQLALPLAVCLGDLT